MMSQTGDGRSVKAFFRAANRDIDARLIRRDNIGFRCITSSGT
jgi:hypothetical protein